MSLLASIALALLLDYWLAEPKRWHPLVGFGHYALWLEKHSLRTSYTPLTTKMMGLLVWCVAVLPWVLLALLVAAVAHLFSAWLYSVIAGVVLYLALGWKSLLQHARAIAVPLAQGNMTTARQALAMIVSRDTEALNTTQIATAATESVLENGADAILAALFWFIVAGIPGVILYRLSNTLDAMWGYKSTRYLHFGWAAARIDDFLNFIPARFTAFSYVIVGALQQNAQRAWRSWRRQARDWKSPNAGPVMAAGAGALGVTLGGSASYHGQTQVRSILGEGQAPQAATINAACQLVNRSLGLWLLVLMLVFGWFNYGYVLAGSL